MLRCNSPKRNVAIQCERERVHKLGSIRHQCEQGNSQELLVYAGSLQNNIDDIDQDF